MGRWFDRAAGAKRTFSSFPIFFVVTLAATLGGWYLFRGTGTANETTLFDGKEVSAGSISSATVGAGNGAAAVLNDDTTAKERPLPVWPPTSAAASVDPAANPMIAAPPQHVDWPYPPPSARAKPPSEEPGNAKTTP